MDNEIKILADQLIAKHKKAKDGTFKWGSFIWSIRHIEGQFALHMAARDLLIERQLIKFYIDNKRDITQLTAAGWDWKSFAIESAEAEKRDRDLKRMSWPQRNWIWIGIFSFLAGISADVIKEAVIRTLWPEEKSASKPPDSTMQSPKTDTTRRK